MKHWGLSILIGLLSILCASATGDVVLVDKGDNVELVNDTVSATINKSSARLIALSHEGDALLGNGGVGYLQVYVEHSFSSPDNAQYRVVTQSDTMVDIAHTWSVSGLEFEFHYVLRDGDSGLYSYLMVQYDPARTDHIQIEQLSYAFRTDKAIFTRMYADDERIVDMPSTDELRAGTTLAPVEVTLLQDGRIDHKYHYSKFVKDMDVHGWTGHGKGHWMISPSNEYMNGGPSNQELAVHQSTKTPIALRMIHGAHYGAGVTSLDKIDGPWTKFFGPWLIYLNEGDDGATMWAQAKEKALQEQSAWPYAWLNHPAYPAADVRGTVHGKLSITDGSNPAGAMVLLAQPTDGTDDTHWQRQGKGYIYWAKANEEGHFEIENVRTGTYTLYAHVAGVLDEYIQDGIAIKTGANALGTLHWSPQTHGALVWQIGVPDRSAAEYRHGDDYRHYALWESYVKDFPKGVQYRVGASDWAKDWNFAQWCVATGDGKYISSPWTIEFQLDDVSSSGAVLTVALAASRNAHLKVVVNGTEVHSEQILTGDGAGHRAGVQGFYQKRSIPLDSALLHANGMNTIVLEQTRSGLFNNIMYDSIRLEMKEDSQAK